MAKPLNQYPALVAFIEKYPVFEIHNNTLFCKVCNVVKVYTPSEGVNPLKRHMRVASHTERLHLKETQTRLNLEKRNSSSLLDTFDAKLVLAFTNANIPLHKLNNECFKEFLQEFTNQKIKDESFYRKNILEEIYSVKYREIKQRYCDKPVYLVFDETTDAAGRYILNILIGECSKYSRTSPSLIKTVELPRTNSENVNFEIIQLLMNYIMET